jgi:hypothetical protein
MLRSHRRVLQFDSLEGKALLSVGLADPAVAVHRATVRKFVLNGTLHGLPSGSAGSDGYTISSFSLTGHLGSMGNVRGTFLLDDTFVPIGKLPDLNNSLLIVTNQKGSLLLSIEAKKINRYRFDIVAVTSRYESVSGAGSLVVSSSRGSLDLSLTFRSAHDS